jgi:hypothetical protein
MGMTSAEQKRNPAERAGLSVEKGRGNPGGYRKRVNSRNKPKIVILSGDNLHWLVKRHGFIVSASYNDLPWFASHCEEKKELEWKRQQFCWWKITWMTRI